MTYTSRGPDHSYSLSALLSGLAHEHRPDRGAAKRIWMVPSMLLFPSEVKVQLRAIPGWNWYCNRIDRYDLTVEFYSKDVRVMKSDKIDEFVVKLLLKLDEKILKKDSEE